MLRKQNVKLFQFSVLGVVTSCFQADSTGKLSVYDGQLLDLNCISKGGKPAAGIDWKVEGSAVKENVASRSELESNGFRFTSISTLKLKVRPLHSQSRRVINLVNVLTVFEEPQPPFCDENEQHVLV